MSLILREATAADATALAEIYFSAFSIDAISLLVFPRDNSATFKWWYDSIVEEIDDPNSAFICICDSSSKHQKAVAFAKWNFPSAPISTALPSWPEGSDTELANHFFGNLGRRHEENMKGRKHWYLELVATLPEYQGRGAGGQLLRWGIKKADEESAEIYLEASPHGKPIYERLGFQEVDRLVVELKKEVLGQTQFVEVFMIRSAKTT
jgi:ribosomal protein S18 acetylase RimI-like enzyme